MWSASQALERQGLRIFIAAPELWTPLCEEEWGFAYHLERWFHHLLTNHLPAVLTTLPEEADYVYVPHCSMNVYLSWKQGRLQERLKADFNAFAQPEHGEGDTLHADVLRELDEQYLTSVIAPAALGSSAGASCIKRSPACRLLFVNMAFGRDELQNFHEAIGQDAVFITTAGASPRIGELEAKWRSEGCSCSAHCKPRLALGPLDIVVPWNIGHNSTSGQTGLGNRRSIHAFFAGSNTSCSRHEIVQRWGHSQEHGFLIAEKSFQERAFNQAARRSLFCLVPDGHWPSTQRLPAVIAKARSFITVEQK